MIAVLARGLQGRPELAPADVPVGGDDQGLVERLVRVEHVPDAALALEHDHRRRQSPLSTVGLAPRVSEAEQALVDDPATPSLAACAQRRGRLAGRARFTVSADHALECLARVRADGDDVASATAAALGRAKDALRVRAASAHAGSLHVDDGAPVAPARRSEPALHLVTGGTAGVGALGTAAVRERLGVDRSRVASPGRAAAATAALWDDLALPRARAGRQ